MLLKILKKNPSTTTKALADHFQTQFRRNFLKKGKNSRCSMRMQNSTLEEKSRNKKPREIKEE